MSIDKEIYISFVMVWHNQNQYTSLALETLFASIEKSIINKGVEIILVNNGSVKPLNHASLNTYEDIELIEINLTFNMGYPVGANYGLAKSRGQIIILVNNDMVFTKGWLEPLIVALESQKDVGVVGPMFSNASLEQHRGISLTNITDIHKSASKYMNKNDESIEVDRIIGACMAMRREIIDTVGGNDFWFGPGYYDDDDLCLRIKIAGYKILLVKKSFVYHYTSVSFQKEGYPLNELIHNQRKKFNRKWGLKAPDERQLVLSRNYDLKEDIYVPINKEFFIKGDISNRIDGYLVVADWSNFTSNWSDILYKLLKKRLNDKCYLWRPSKYFETIEDIRMPDLFECYTEPVAHIKLLNFIRQFKGTVKIPNDFINAYILELTDKGCIINI